MSSHEKTPRKPSQQGSRAINFGLAFMLALTLGAVWQGLARPAGPGGAPVDYSTFYGWVEQHKVERVTFKGAHLSGALRAPEKVDGADATTFETELPDRDDALLPLLRARGVRIEVARETRSAIGQLALTLLPWLLIIGAWTWLSRRPGPLGRIGELTKSKGRRFEAEGAPSVKLEDVAGLEGAKRDLAEIVQFLKAPAQFRRLGAKAPRGVLLVGPPGTGKTLLARAVAGESQVPFYSINASEFVEMFVGLGAARVRDLFAEAKRQAPAIVFIDEIDAVGRSRGAGLGMGNDEREQTLNQLLAEMDGFAREHLVVVLAATNRPDVLDAALLRPGRFDRRVVVSLPELDARRAILAVHTKDKPLAPDVDLDTIAAGSVGFSGADLANMVNEAALGATRRLARQITAADFATAEDKIVLGDPREGRLSADERRRVAVHEAGHAVVARFHPLTLPPRRVSILPRGLALGATQQLTPEDRHLSTRGELLARVATLMGGYAAEQAVFGEVSTGAESDLKQATELAGQMVAHFGMSDRLGPVYYEHDAEHPFLGKRVATDGGTSDATAHAIENETRRILGEALARAGAVLREHRAAVDRLSQELLARETLELTELEAVLAPVAAEPTTRAPSMALVLAPAAADRRVEEAPQISRDECEDRAKRALPGADDAA
ncbi:MAG TPA: ATP-dependent zinc metalloprotease FtsH [Polyangia bacterium]|jgi:cell division protease FtsH|nr:ATP-dependent zinc metalloprotease FtsH [Polyangia bacterium]